MDILKAEDIIEKLEKDLSNETIALNTATKKLEDTSLKINNAKKDLKKFWKSFLLTIVVTPIGAPIGFQTWLYLTSINFPFSFAITIFIGIYLEVMGLAFLPFAVKEYLTPSVKKLTIEEAEIKKEFLNMN